MTEKKATLAEIARRCGVSKPTVSAILGSSPRITSRYGAATREKVRAMARKIGYRPNRAARMMSLGRHGAIGMLVQELPYLDQAVLGGLLRAARRRDRVLILEQAPANDADSAAILEEEMIDGLILFMNMPGAVMKRVRAFRGPVLYFNTNRRSGSNAVTPDDEGGVRLAVERFAATGRKNPAILGPRTSASGHYSSQVRRETFHSVCRELGMRVAWDLAVDPGEGGSESDDALSLIIERFRIHPETDGVLATHTNLIPWLREAVRSPGLAVSDHLAAIAFDHAMPYPIGGFEFASLRIPPGQAAESIMDRMDALIAGKIVRNAIRLGYQLLDTNLDRPPHLTLCTSIIDALDQKHIQP